ncbi:S24 family peptidase [Burkholderia cepacia]|uniref:S24 family peptidase n=1 Tax=Burkholderia cepacia TaxID=292 RepID=UPI00075A43C3|nr:S24 family peptidase [Burkholderia cepacia]KWH52543.1 repressor [Burkholderia cepacia]
MKSTFGSRLKEARNEAGLTQKQLASKAGIKQATVSELENDKYQGSAFAAQLAAAVGVSALWLADGKGDKHTSTLDDDGKTGQASSVIKRLLPDDKGNVVTWERAEDLEHDEHRVWIDRYDYRFSAGTGLIQWEIRQKKALPFDIGFFKALGVKPHDCKLAQVHGPSMEPYLFNRDLMMICTTRNHVRDGRIYAVYFEDEPLVKQIFKEPEGALRLHSYNPDYPDRIIAADQLASLQIAGEVMYRSGSGPAGGN